MPILLKILLNVGKMAVALFLVLYNSGRLREELTLEQFERAESFRAEREAAARPLTPAAFEAAFSDQPEPLAVDAFWAMVFQRPYGGLGWRLTPVRECLAQMAEPGLAYIQRHCYLRLQELQSTNSYQNYPANSFSNPSSKDYQLDYQNPRLRLELLLFYRCFFPANDGVSKLDYELHNSTVTAFKRERDNYILTFENHAPSTTSNCSPYWLHDYDGFSQVDSPPVVIDRNDKSVAALVSGFESPKANLDVALLLKDDAADPGKLAPLVDTSLGDRGCLLDHLQPGSGLISSGCANLVKEKLPHLLGLYAAYRCFLPAIEGNEEYESYVIHAAKVRNMIPEAGGGGDNEVGESKKVIIYFELEQNTTTSNSCEPSWERYQLLLDTAAAQDEEDGVAVADEL